MSVRDVWRIVADIYTFSWVPAWAWWGAVIWLVLAAATGVGWSVVKRRYPPHDPWSVFGGVADD